MVVPSFRRGSSPESRAPSRVRIVRSQPQHVDLARVRDARDARVATTVFAVAVGAVLAIAGLEQLGVIMAAVAGLQALAAGYAQVRLWRLRVQRLAEAGSAAG